MSLERCAPMPKVFSVRFGDVGRWITTGSRFATFFMVACATFLEGFPTFVTARLMLQR